MISDDNVFELGLIYWHGIDAFFCCQLESHAVWQCLEWTWIRFSYGPLSALIEPRPLYFSISETMFWFLCWTITQRTVLSSCHFIRQTSTDFFESVRCVFHENSESNRFEKVRARAGSDPFVRWAMSWCNAQNDRHYKMMKRKCSNDTVFRRCQEEEFLQFLLERAIVSDKLSQSEWFDHDFKYR